VLDWERGELLPGEGRKGELYISWRVDRGAGLNRKIWS